MRVPLGVFVVWRAAHALVVVAFGGDLRQVTYAFDGQYYLSLLREGYVAPVGGYGEFSNVAFFPGLVWLTDAVQVLVRSQAVATGLVANGLALAAFLAVWAAVRAWTGDQALARRAVLGLALTPTSYYLWMYYSEALLVAATASAAAAARTGRHTTAAALLAAASTSRLVGVLVGPVLAAVRIVRLRRVDGSALLYLAGSGLGAGLVLLRQWLELGDPFGWNRAQEAWGREAAPPWVPIVTGVRDVVESLPVPAEGVALDLVTVAGLAVLVGVLLRGAVRGRWPLEPALLAAAFWLVPLCSRLVSSSVRFALACWPVLLVPAAAWPRLGRALRTAVVVLAAGLSVVLLRRLALGAFTA